MTTYTFNQQTAIKAATFSILAYKEEDDFIIPEGYTLIREIIDKKTDTRGIILRNENDVILSFRGTASFKNVLTDIKIFKIIYPKRILWLWKYKSHKGFAEAYIAIRDELKKALRENIKKDDEVLITGHSLGGALATIAALDFKRSLKFKNELAVYTFGSPKIGNNNFVKVYNKKVKNSFRIVNDEDIVPQAPPGRFDHVDTYVLIDEGKKLIINPGFFEKLEKRFEGTGGVLTGKSLKAHSSEGYLEFMKTLRPEQE